MIDTIFEVTETTSSTGLTIEPTNIFVEDGSFREAGLMEHIAQSAAAGLGYRCKQQGKAVPLGFIAALKKLTIHKLPRINEAIKTEIKIINQVFNTTIVLAETISDNQKIADCEMRIFVNENQ
jgi:predicted hotdog family 3-hydroxylacyl-ACP dehydratase